jgi:hypothetical protein
MGTGERDVKKFRHAYVIKPGQFNFSPLEPYCGHIVFVTDGYGDHVDNIREQLYKSLKDFDADKDVIIPVGSAMVAVLAGQVLQEVMGHRTDWDSFAMGIFLEGGYHFWRVHTDPEKESYEIILV